MIRREASELPAHDGPAGIGKLPSFRLILVPEVLAGCARERAEARQGSTLERSFGGADACHRAAMIEHHGRRVNANSRSLRVGSSTSSRTGPRTISIDVLPNGGRRTNLQIAVDDLNAGGRTRRRDRS